MNSSREIANLIKAFIKCKALIKNPVKNKQGYSAKYADLPQVLEIIEEATLPNDLIFFQLVGEIVENKISVLSVLAHNSGEYIETNSQTFVDDRMKSSVQGVGSAVTYVKRKAAVSFFGMAEEDEVDSHGMAKDSRKETLALVVSPTGIDILKNLIGQSSNPMNTEMAILDKLKRNSLDELSSLEANEYIHKLGAKIK